jgi:hypothetical protein
MERTLFEDRHHEFRSLAPDFLRAECAPHVERWEHNGIVDRGIWTKAGIAPAPPPDWPTIVAIGHLLANYHEEWPSIPDPYTPCRDHR